MITSDDRLYRHLKLESFPDDDLPSADESAKENLFTGSASENNKKSKTPVLDNFGRDLTHLPEEGN